MVFFWKRRTHTTEKRRLKWFLSHRPDLANLVSRWEDAGVAAEAQGPDIWERSAQAAVRQHARELRRHHISANLEPSILYPATARHDIE